MEFLDCALERLGTYVAVIHNPSKPITYTWFLLYISFHSPSDVPIIKHFPYRPAVDPSSKNEPRSNAEQKNRSKNHTRVIHVLRADGLVGWEDTEYDDHDRKCHAEPIDQNSKGLGQLEWAQRKVLLAVFPHE